MGVGQSGQRLLEEAGRSLRTLRRWARRWRQRALHTIPWLASMVQAVNPECGLPKYWADEAPPTSRRVVAEELRWLDALEGWRALQGIDVDMRGWAWANLRFAGRIAWF